MLNRQKRPTIFYLVYPRYFLSGIHLPNRYHNLLLLSLHLKGGLEKGDRLTEVIIPLSTKVSCLQKTNIFGKIIYIAYSKLIKVP